MAEATALSVVPPLVAVGLAVITRRVSLSLLLGVWLGAVLFTGTLGIGQTLDWIVAAILADEGTHVQILLSTLLLGAGVALIWRLGGAVAIRNWALKRIDTRRKAELLCWGLGTSLFFDDHASAAIVGCTMKESSDGLRISREKLSYLVDSTAAPAATLGISSWVAFQLSMIERGYAETGLPADETPGSFSVFLDSWPFNMYSILALVMAVIIVVSQRDFGEMLFADQRAATTGKLNRDGAHPIQELESDLGEAIVDDPPLTTFVVPILALVVGVLGVTAWTGNVFQGVGVTEFSDTADFTLALLVGSFGMVVSSYVLGYAYGTLSLGERVETTGDGFGIVVTAVVILVLAWSLGEAVSALETATFVAEQIDGVVGEALLPVVVFLAAAFVAFLTGSSWGALSILTPTGVAVAWDIAASHELVAVVVGTLFSGAVFGDHSSPISETTVLAATFSGADLVDHVRTQLYYAVTVALVVVALLLVWGYTGTSPWLLLLVGAGTLVGLVYGLSTLQTDIFDGEPVREPDYEQITRPEE